MPEMTSEQLRAALARPFDPSEVKWKPQTIKGNKALAVAFVDARLVMGRLDDVFGVGGWETEYREMGNGSVVCTLRCKVGDRWVTHQDVGSESEQPDDGDRTKSAFSDALKRAAVHYGVGRYLYRLPAQWRDYDPVKRQFVRPPQLPEWARPAPAASARAGKASELLAEIERMRAELHIDEPIFAARIAEHFGNRPLTALSEGDLKRVLGGLRNAAQRGSEVAS